MRKLWLKDMGNIKFELNSEGIKKLLKSSEMQAGLKEYVSKVQNSAGEGYTVSSYVGKSRANVSVHAKTKKAKKDNLKNNTLLKALGSAKG